MTAVLAPADVLAAFDRSTVGVGLVDAEHRYVHVNPALAAMNRLSVAEHLGRRVEEVLPHAAATVGALLTRVLAGEAVLDLPVVAESAGGERRYVVSYLPVGPKERPAGVLAVLVPVDDGAPAEGEVRVTQDRLEVALEGTETGSFEWHVADDRLRWSANLAPLWGRERGWAPADYDEYLATIAPEDRPGMVAAVERVLREGGGFDLDFRVDGADGRRRWMHTRTHVLRGEDGTPSVLVGLVADATTRKRRELASAFLAEATLALSASLDPEATLRQVAESAVPILADWCAVHVLAEGGAPRRLAVAHTEPHKEELVAELERRYPPDPDAATGVPAVLRTGRPELYPVVGDDLLAAAAVDDEHLGLLRRLALHSGLVVPIVAHGRVLGAMTFAYADSERTYGDEDLALAEELGRRAGAALENARLHDAERRARDRLQRLQAVTDVGLTHLGLDELMPELLRRVRDLCDGDFAVLLLLDERGEALAVEAAVGLEEEVTTGVRIPVGRGVAGRIAARGRPEVIDDLHAREVISPYLRERGRSLVGVPLRDAGRVVGVLHVSSHEPGHFSAADVELLELVADRVTRAVSHARVYAATRDIALTLQRSLLPEALAVPEGYEAAARYLPGTAGVEVGGDWYDLFRLGDGRRAIVVGDVAGRGTGAAAAMGTLRAALRAHLHHAAAPADALMRVDALLADTSPGLYATAVVLVLDPASGELVAATAGHPPPLLRGPGGCRAVELPTGPPLGVARPREESTFALRAGETLLLCTDGLVERPGTPLDERLERLRAAFADAGGAVLDAVTDELLAAMLADAQRPDDVALLLLRRQA